jgi:hypothetical protein
VATQPILTQGRNRRAGLRPLLASVATLCFGFAGPALAQSQQAVASGSVTIVQPAGAGVAYDVATQVLTSIFLSGQKGQQLSLLLPGRRLRNHSLVPALQAQSGPGNILVLSTDTVSINVETVDVESAQARRNRGFDTMLVLAQFN